MVQNNTPSSIAVMEVFFKEPTKIHFIKEISRKIKLAPTSIRKYLSTFLKEDIINVKKAHPFNGLVSNRDNDAFIFYKRAYNLYSLKELRELIINSIHPQAIVLFGSYSRGEDIETSDIDILIISKVKKDISVSNMERKMERKINIMVINDLKELDKVIQKKINNGIVLYGEI